MPLLVHRAPRADLLAESLADLLRTPLGDPFAKELVLVPARGVERWLSQRLSHRLGHAPGREDGVCAGVEFRSPASLIAEVTGTRDNDPWAPDALVWPLLGVVDAHAGEPWCRALSEHLGHGREGEEGELRKGRRYAVARRLARLFGSYAAQRPVLLADWEAGRDRDGAGGALAPDLLWQAELWRLLVAEVGEPTPGERQASVIASLRDDPAAAELPSRFSLFGHTRIPVTEVALLGALAVHHEVHLWLPHPSEALWQALDGLSGAVPRRDDPSHERVGHPLLATLGRDLRELERTLGGAPSTGQERAPASISSPEVDQSTLLGRLQQDIAANALPEPAIRTLDPGDRSVQVHACHGPARQVEVLREVLLGLLADDPTLEPREILVMCPDIEAFAPLISAGFGMGDAIAGGHPGHQLRVRLADRALTQTNPLLAVAGQLLDLSGGRAEASRVLDLLATDPVRRRFGFSESDLETITSWVENAGVRWAFDQAHRKNYGLDGYVQNTWRFGLDRILTGVAVSDDAERWLDTTLPFDDVGSTTIDLAGRLAEFVERLRDVTDRLTGSHPVGHWLSALAEGIALLTTVPRGEEWQSGQVQRELAALADDAVREPGEALTLRLPDVRALMGERLSGRPTRANFRTGTLTVCTMVPMRSVPHRVVCLLGLDDGVFPRAGAVDGDDVLARNPLTGERDPRSEDRQLMLDAVVAAGEHLVITYTGANETTGHPRPPAVPLGELLDALDATVTGGKDHVVTHHPLQAFDRRNLGPGDFHPDGPFSFDSAALAGARAAERPRHQPADLAGPPLPPSVPDVDLAELTTFLKQPVKEFLRKRLVLALTDDGDEVSDGLPVELDGLVQWGVGDRLLRDLLRRRTPGEALQKEWRRGVLPPGQLGWRLAQQLCKDAVPVAEMADAAMGGLTPGAVDVDVDLGGGRRLRGTVTDLYAERLVKVNFSRLGPKHMLDAWLPLVALSAHQPGRSWTAGAIGRGRRGQPTARIAFKKVDDAAQVLADLVAIYDAGMCEPLPLAVKAGHAWAAQRRPDSDAPSRAAAEREWAPRSWEGENAEPAHVRVWGPRSSLDTLLAIPPRDGEDYPGERTRFGALSMRLWQPILERGYQS